MEVLLYVGLGVFFLYTLIRVNQEVLKQVNDVIVGRNVDDIEIPLELGVREELPIKQSVDLLEEAMNNELKNKIKYLFYREPKNKDVSEHEFELRYFELQRYFIMCSLLKDVPMFSDEVDEVWHSFILATRDYEQFSKQFIGEFLHHNPAFSKVPNPHGRAWFDLIYTQLYYFTDFTGMTWGGFYRFPLSKEQINEIINLSVQDLTEKYFRMGANQEIVTSCILQLKEHVETALSKGMSDKKHPFKPERSVPSLRQAPFYSQAMIFYSSHSESEYLEKMSGVHQSFKQSATSAYACGSGT